MLVLNTGAIIKPEDRAMLQALHSRSVGGVKSHLKVLAEKGSEKFIKTYFVGYGHKSIGDMAECIMFIENVSMLCTKAVQDNRLYRGQEASTRYIDFAKQPFIDPLGTPDSKALLEGWRTIYLRAFEKLVPHLKAKYPRGEGEKELAYNNAITAAAFDRARCYLPAGAATNVAWTGDFRTVADRLCWLRHHPLEEVREIALASEDALIERHPSGFSNKRYMASEECYAKAMESYYFAPDQHPEWSCVNSVDASLLNSSRVFEIFWTRPPKTELPKWLEKSGNVRFDFLLDFGSFRDLQRHRAVVQRMPLLTTKFGFEPWYLEQLPPDLQQDVRFWLALQEDVINTIKDPLIAQYYTAMGYRVPNQLIGSIPALVYLVELRANRFTHPTLRKRAQQMAEWLGGSFRPYGLKIHLDPDPDRFDIRRGEQTIIEKN